MRPVSQPSITCTPVDFDNNAHVCLMNPGQRRAQRETAVTFQRAGPLVEHITRLVLVQQHLVGRGRLVISRVLVVPLPVLGSRFRQPRDIVHPLSVCDHLQSRDFDPLPRVPRRGDLGCKAAADSEVSPGPSMCRQPPQIRQKGGVREERSRRF